MILRIPIPVDAGRPFDGRCDKLEKRDFEFVSQPHRVTDEDGVTVVSDAWRCVACGQFLPFWMPGELVLELARHIREKHAT